VEEAASRQAKVAVMLPASKEAREAVQFYELACKNNGWRVQVFSERQSALDWLAGNKSDSGNA
jgi:hypothetical protein